MLATRIGEATNPGPADWVLGCMNPTGLPHKAAICSELEAGSVWAVSETHLSLPGQALFKKELRYQRSGLVDLRGRAPYQIGGKQTGVAFLHTCPGPRLTQEWPCDHSDAQRLATGAFMINHSMAQHR